ncbi:hypothetical protein LCGC14_2809060, partial [marine sediment metagenome]
MAKFFLPNPGFELGDRDWAKGAGWAIAKDLATARSGSWRAIFTGASAAFIETALLRPVRPGGKITLSAFFDGSIATAGTARVYSRWFDKDGVFISETVGNAIAFGSGYSQSAVTDSVAPDRAKLLRLSALITAPNGSTWRLDDFDASGDIIEVFPVTAKIQSHSMLLARTIGRFDPLIGADKFTEFNAG